MFFFIIGILLTFGSVGGLECGNSIFTFIMTVAIGIICILRGIQKIIEDS